MKNSLSLALFLMGLSGLLFGQATETTFLSNWHNDDLPVVGWLNGRYNECWGFERGGHEYGVLGSTNGLHFIDVTNPTAPFEAFFIEGTSAGSHIVHRDFKDFNGYLYAVADEGSSSLQIINIQDLPNSLTEVYNSNEFVVTAHNLFIDTSQLRLYLLGEQGQTTVLDISNPTDPVLLGSYPNPTFYMPYVHDAYIRDHIGYMDCGTDGFWVIDFSNPANPVVLGTMTDYQGAGYNHSGWLSEDGHYYYMLDETHGSPVKVVDVSDFSNMQVKTTISAFSAPTQIPHNALIKGNKLYVSYYYDGLQVYDITDPLNIQRTHYYDTYPGADEDFFAGAWGVFPLLPSGNILISDIQSGLWVFQSVEGENYNLYPSATSFEACKEETVEFEVIVGDAYADSGVTLEAQGTVPGTVEFSPNPALPGATVLVTIKDLVSTPGNPVTFTIYASDGENEKSFDVSLDVTDVPAAAAQQFPLPDAVEVPVQPTFEWSDAGFNATYKLKIAGDLANFNSNIVYSAATPTTELTLSTNLAVGKTYYWLVESKNDCGTNLSPIQTFTTEGANNTSEPDREIFSFQPNPTQDVLTLYFANGAAANTVVSLSSPTGQAVLSANVPVGSGQAELDLSALPAGGYWLSVKDGNGTTYHRVAKVSGK